MIDGGLCRYRGGSQLAAATSFLQAHRGRVLLVTLDIGANDPEQCGLRPGLSQLARCAVKDIPSAVTRLATIMDRLKAAAGLGGPHRRDDLLPARTRGMAQRPAWARGAWAAEQLAATSNHLLTRSTSHPGAGGERVRRLRDADSYPGRQRRAA